MKPILILFRAIWVVLLALLGFSVASCKTEYGSPHADYKLKGDVVSEETGKAIAGIRVVKQHYYTHSEGEYIHLSDTLFTDSKGAFLFSWRDYGGYGDVRLKFEDVDGAVNGRFDSLTRKVKMNVKPTGGSGSWYEGTATKDLGQIGLAPSEALEE